jgi:sporulation protein YabP
VVKLADTQKNSFFPHNCILEDRKRLSVSGVTNVESFDEETIVATTDCGELNIKGRNLHITKLSLEIGELSIEGSINALQYSDIIEKNTGFFSKVFR